MRGRPVRGNEEKMRTRARPPGEQRRIMCNLHSCCQSHHGRPCLVTACSGSAEPTRHTGSACGPVGLQRAAGSRQHGLGPHLASLGSNMTEGEQVTSGEERLERRSYSCIVLQLLCIAVCEWVGGSKEEGQLQQQKLNKMFF